MKKVILLSIAFIWLSVCSIPNANAQGIGVNSSGNPADPSAILDASSTTKGQLIPRMTTAQRNAISNPAQALQIYNTTTRCLEIYEVGFWQIIWCSCTPVAASVSISANPSGAICSGDSVTITATPANGGTTPTYQWNNGGTAISGATNSTYSYTPTTGDVITCVLTSNASCVTGNPATSGTITMTVNSAPSAPTATAGTGVTSYQITTNWNAVINATSYALDVSTNTNFSTGLVINNQNVGNVLTYNITGLTPATTYYYRVRAINNNCIGGNSNIITTTTTANIAANIVVYWKLDESSGDASDATGNGYTGTNIDVTYSAGKINNGGVFNGGSSVLTTTTPINTNTFSVSAWVYLTNYSNYNNILRQENGGGGFLFRIEQTTGLLRVYGSGGIDLSSTSVIPLSQWVFVTATSNTSGTTIYINGTSDATNAQTATVNTTNLWIGSGGAGPEWFTGEIDEVGFWSRALTSTEVTTLYNNGNGLQYPF